MFFQKLLKFRHERILDKFVIIIISFLSQFYIWSYWSCLGGWYFLDSKWQHITLSIQNRFDSLSSSQQASFLHEVAIVVSVHTLGSSWKFISFAHHPVNNHTDSVKWPEVLLLLCKHFIFSNHMTDYFLVKHCLSSFLSILIVLSACSCVAINIPSVPSSAFLFLASSRYPGTSLHLFSS